MSVVPAFSALLCEGKRRWRLLSALAVFAIGCGCVGCSSNPISLPEDNDFLSYWQCAEGLANGLQQVRSKEEFLKAPLGGRAVDPEEAESLKDILDAVCDNLEAFQKKLAQLPADEIERLTDTHADLVQRVKTATEELARRHKEAPQILDEDWDRYWRALHPAVAVPD